MVNYKHLSLDERKTIEDSLRQGVSFSAIAERIGRNKNTIAREVMRNSLPKRTGAVGQAFNNCANRRACTQYRLCKKEDCLRQCCKGCRFCFRLCPDFLREHCPKLSLPPYVCNGCHTRHKCTLEKFLYQATVAHASASKVLSSSRDGIAVTQEELSRLDGIISPLLRQGQSIYAILENHKDEIMLDEKTIRKYVNAGLFAAGSMDLLRTVKMRPRRKKKEVKVERACREGRTYRDFLAYMEQYPDTPVVQMDTVEGTKGVGEPVLLTIHFVASEFMLAFRREANTARSVLDIINSLYELLGANTFRSWFPLILCDNGSEFSAPSAMETAPDGTTRTRVFFTEPSAPYQKGACENNHSLIRRVIKKGLSLHPYAQADIQLLMNHINAYVRKKLNGQTPFATFSFFYGSDDPKIFEKLGVALIPQDEVTLTPALLQQK